MPYRNLPERRCYQRKYQQDWRQKNSEKWAAILDKSDKKRRETSERQRQQTEIRSRVHHRNKTKVLELYGKACAYCGELKYEVLCVDHIHDDGATHRKTIEFKRFATGGMWGFLSKTPFRPDLYQILCHNCNAVKQFYGIAPGRNSYHPFDWWKDYAELRPPIFADDQLSLSFDVDTICDGDQK